MYCAAISAIAFNRISKHMTKLVALSLKVLQEGMKWTGEKLQSVRQLHSDWWHEKDIHPHWDTLGPDPKKQRTETPKTLVLRHPSFESSLIQSGISKPVWSAQTILQGRGSAVIPLDLAVCVLVTHKSWRREESILGALGNLLRKVLILKIYLISFLTATNQ